MDIQGEVCFIYELNGAVQCITILFLSNALKGYLREKKAFVSRNIVLEMRISYFKDYFLESSIKIQILYYFIPIRISRNKNQFFICFSGCTINYRTAQESFYS